MDYRDRITIEPGKRGGKPCIRGLRITVYDVLAAHVPGSTHGRDIGLARADDDTIWPYARDHGFAVVSKDSDFHQRSPALGAPPKLIWVRVGNAPAAAIGVLLVERRTEIEAFMRDAEATFLSIARCRRGFRRPQSGEGGSGVAGGRQVA
jgi:predicted nuclease of predicted toxin-antitoxin system